MTIEFRRGDLVQVHPLAAAFKIQWIKAYRDIHLGVGLKEAKEISDTIFGGSYANWNSDRTRGRIEIPKRPNFFGIVVGVHGTYVRVRWFGDHSIAMDVDAHRLEIVSHGPLSQDK